jgi:hypothetical protein
MNGMPPPARRLALAAVLLSGFALLSLVTVYFQVAALGLEYINTGEQWRRHLALLEGRAGSPWQYRLLSVWIIEGFRFAAGLFGDIPVMYSFLALRCLQNVAIFALAWAWWKECSISVLGRTLGLGILGLSFTQALHDSDLSFNTYFEIVFYLAAAILLARGRTAAFLVVVLLASLNRETSALMVLAPLLTWYFGGAGEGREKLKLCAAAALVYAVPFVAVRMAFPDQAVVKAYGNVPGLSMMKFNFLRAITYEKLFLTLGLLPLTAALAYPFASPALKGWFWLLVPVWFTVHLVSAVGAETRMFLVPLAVVMIPATLAALESTRS